MSTLSRGAPRSEVDGHETRRRNAIKGAFWSEFIDMFDIYLPVVVLAPIMSFFQPPALSSGTVGILASLVFVTTLLGRPLGATLFGIFADRIGRRRASIYSAAGFGTVTLLIALLPGYERAGLASYGLLVTLRFLDGVFIGGSYTGAMPLAIEYSRKSQRGLVGGLIMAGFPAAYLCINLLAMLMLALFPLHGLHSPYVEYGWRIPFVLGALFAAALTVYYVRSVAESEIWQLETAPQAERLPLTDLIRGPSARKLAQVLLLMTGFWLTQNIMTLYLPTTLLRQTLHLSSFDVTLTLLITYLVLTLSYIGSGLLGQRLGRRRLFLLCGASIAVIGALLLYLLTGAAGTPLPQLIALVCVFAVLVTSPWGALVTYINERFVTDVRATAFGVGFSLSVIVPSFYAFYLNWLGAWLPARVAPAALLALGGLIAALGAWLGPETRDIDL